MFVIELKLYHHLQQDAHLVVAKRLHKTAFIFFNVIQFVGNFD